MPTVEQINELKHRALLLRIEADERAKGLAAQYDGVAAGFEVRDVHLDNLAKFAEAVVAILEPMLPPAQADPQLDRASSRDEP